MKPDILLVDDEPSVVFGFSRFFSGAGYSLTSASSLAEAREAVGSQRFDAVILDLNLPDGSGMDWINELREGYPGTAIIVITGAGDVPLAVDAMRRGADNFLTKPVSLSDLDIFLRKGLEAGALRRKDMTQQLLSKKNEPYFGASAAMQKTLQLASTAAENNSTVLLQGETGSGKGILAKWIYENGAHKAGPFVDINCSGLKGDLLASELFGHVKGAFTSASGERKGLIEVADGGTLFLDEIADMELSVQAQFLKVVEEQQYRRLGDARVRRSNFRLIAATNRDLAEEVRRGAFRPDLFFRINVFPIEIPPLRLRLEDLPELARRILSSLKASAVISPEVMPLLLSYPWPGNVRELKNALERAVLISRGGPLRPEHFPGLLEWPTPEESPRAGDRDLGLIERDHIRNVIGEAGGDMKKAAEKLKISRATLYRKLKKFS